MPHNHNHAFASSEASVLTTIFVPEDASKNTTLGIGLLVGAGVVTLLVLAAGFALWKYRGEFAKRGMYSFGAPPSAEEGEGDEGA